MITPAHYSKDNLMEQIIPKCASHYNNNFSSSTVVGNVTTPIRSKPKYIPTDLFKIITAKKHQAAKKAIEGLGYRSGIKSTLAAVINLSDVNGVSNASHRRLAHDAECSTKTTERHTDQLHKDGIVRKIRNGKHQVNTYILLFFKPELNNRTDKMSAYLNPSEAPPEGWPHEGGLGEENKRSESLADALPSQDETIWDDAIEVEARNKETSQIELKKMRESLLKH